VSQTTTERAGATIHTIWRSRWRGADAEKTRVTAATVQCGS